jgi:hypothetical protein
MAFLRMTLKMTGFDSQTTLPSSTALSISTTQTVLHRYYATPYMNVTIFTLLRLRTIANANFRRHCNKG